MRLETERLVVRPWRLDEAPRLLDIKSRVEVVRWLGDEPVELMTDLDAARAEIAAGNAMIPPLGIWAIEVVTTDAPDGPAGSVMLVPVPHSDTGAGPLVQIGWHLHPDTWHHGYAAEAARAVLDHGLAARIDQIHALTHLDNHPSIAVARRIGMRDLGITHDWYDSPSRHFVAP